MDVDMKETSDDVTTDETNISKEPVDKITTEKGINRDLPW